MLGENNITFLGICLGMQLSIIEFARNVLGIEDANSIEFDENTKKSFNLFDWWVYGSKWK